MTDRIDSFFTAWGEGDTAKRADMVRDAMAEIFTYTDPNAPEPINDIGALVEYIGMFTQYAPGATARVAALSEVKGHYRATVAFEMADGKTQHGQYFIDCDADGRMIRMVGFAGLGAPE